jgi:hypothetical protein
MSEAEGRITRNRSLSVQDLRNAIGRHVDFSRQFRCAHIELIQFFGQMFAGM